MRPLIVCSVLLCLPVCGSTIVGINNDPNAPDGGSLYSVDPLTGTATLLSVRVPTSMYYATSTAPDYNAFLAYSPVNLYQLDLFGGISMYVFDEPPVGDLAYDSSKKTLYALATLPFEDTSILLQLADTGLPYPGLDRPHRWVRFYWIGELQVPGIRLIEYVPGLGLYGTDGMNAGYLIDEVTGQASLLASLSWQFGPQPYVPCITGMAYDSDTRRLLASCGSRPLIGPDPWEPLWPGEIFLIEPRTGEVTLLNNLAPNLYGIAAVSTPEPLPRWLVLPALAAFLALRKRVSIPQKLA